MSAPIVVIGAGGFGRETLDVIEAINAVTPTWRLLGVIDDAPAQAHLDRLSARGIPWLSTLDDFVEGSEPVHYVVGIGAPAVRQRLAEAMDAAGHLAATLAHPASGIGSASSIGAGSVICAGVQVSTNVTLGRHVHINPNATIGHDAVLDDFVSVNPGAIISGEVSIGPRALIGAGAVVLQGLDVGSGSTVGAAACVTRSVGVDSVVKGVPAS